MEVTFVLLTCGEKSEKDCLSAIESFKDEISFFEVRDVYPQINALNQMIQGVDTEYFVPLDADIVLSHNAWPRITNALRKHYRNPEWHSILFPLWDTLTERKILALKVMRTEIARQNIFKESATPDVEHYKRLTDQGYTCIHDYLKSNPIGEHRLIGKHFCYHKFRDVYQTFKSHNFEWDNAVFFGGSNLREKAKAHFDFFMHKWVVSNNKDYLHCIAGMMDGILSPVEHKSKNLDDKNYKIPTRDAVHCFYDWYMKEESLASNVGLIF